MLKKLKIILLFFSLNAHLHNAARLQSTYYAFLVIQKSWHQDQVKGQ